MIVYSVTITINKKIESEWLNWMKEVHIPEVINTGFFKDWLLQKLIVPDDTVNDVTFRIDYFLSNFEDYKNYLLESAQKLQDEHSAKFAGKFKANRMVYSIVKK